MASSTHIAPTSFSYAVGNTPPVNFTQALPPDQDADVLLLGCGDAQSILFSVYTSLRSGRKLDITGCDVEIEILARNILLFTLILDDTENKNTEKIWDIYYHVLIDDESLNLLRNQASRLEKVAATAEEWNKGRYGTTLRFCDSYTFFQVLRLWEFYALQPYHGRAFEEQQAQLQRSTQEAREIQKEIVGNGINLDSLNLDSLRSAAPLSDRALDNAPVSYKTFWKTGSSKPYQVTKPSSLNPMFGTTNTRLLLQHRADPLACYHIATSHATLSDDSPLNPDAAMAGQSDKVFKAALNQFHEFAKAFRDSAPRLTIRLALADALALCHTLQHIKVHGNGSTAGWYRSCCTWEPLSLDISDYSLGDTEAVAPLSFDVIETSDVVDHVGCLNLLTAAGSLLKPKPTSTLSARPQVQQDSDIEQQKGDILCGDLQSVSLLFCLVPVEIWTGTTATSQFDERLISDIAGRQTDVAAASRLMIHWKSVAISTEGTSQSSPNKKLPFLTYDPEELAQHLFQIYRSIFQDEDMPSGLSDYLERIQKESKGHYTRASFAAILNHMRLSNMVNWPIFISRLYDLIDKDSVHGARAFYAAELLVHLDSLGLRPMSRNELPSRLRIDKAYCPLRHWTDVPPTLCITMVIPRQKLLLFETTPFRMTKPIVQMVLRAMDMRAQSFYLDIHVGFGYLKVLGNRYSESHMLEVQDDEHRWDGTSPMIPSAMVPSSVALQKPDLSTEVIFGLNHNPHSFAVFGEELGLDLAISRSTLAGSDVYITRNRPNMSVPLSFSGMTASLSPVDDILVPTPFESGMEEPQTRFHVQLNKDKSKVHGLTGHVDVFPGKLQDKLRSGARVQVSQISPFEVSIFFDKPTLVIKRMRFPMPVSMNKSKTKVARKSSYIEFIASAASQEECSARPDSLYLMVQEKGTLALCNPHYVSLDQLPIFNRDNPSELSWLVPCVSDMFSARERWLRHMCMESDLKCEDARVNFKDSLFSIFSHATGTNGAQRHDVLVLNHPQNGGVHMLIFVSSLRFDMSCQNVVLDAAILPLTTDVVQSIKPTIHSIHQRGVVSVILDDEELLIWKHAIPAFTERCRDWKHTSSCEYITSGRIPVSTKFGQQPICSCGKGKFPPGYIKDVPGIWEQVAKYAVRAAIPPCFSVPLVERPFDANDLDELEEWSSDSDSTEDSINEELTSLHLRKGTCFNCGKGDSQSGSLLRCAGCMVAEYCSKDCQRLDWKGGEHKFLCPLLRKK